MFLISTAMKRSYDPRLEAGLGAELRHMSDSALFALPKVELHCHLELAFRRSTLKQWAVERGMNVGEDAAFDEAFLVKAPMQVPSVLHKFLNTRDVIDTEDKVEQLTYEVCADSPINVRA